MSSTAGNILKFFMCLFLWDFWNLIRALEACVSPSSPGGWDHIPQEWQPMLGVPPLLGDVGGSD